MMDISLDEKQQQVKKDENSSNNVTLTTATITVTVEQEQKSDIVNNNSNSIPIITIPVVNLNENSESINNSSNNNNLKSEINSVVILTPPTSPNIENLNGSNIDPPSPMVSENLLGRLTNEDSSNNGNRKSMVVRGGGVGNGKEVNGQRSSGGLDSHKYKTYIRSKLTSHHVKDDPLVNHLIYFPKDDLSLLKTNQNHRTLLQSFNNDVLSELNLHVRNSIESFLAPRKLVVRNYSKYKKEDKPIFEQDKYEYDIIQKEKDRINSGVSNSSGSIININSNGISNSSSNTLGSGSGSSSGSSSASSTPPQQSSPKLTTMKSQSGTGFFSSESIDKDELHFEYLKPYTIDTDTENSEERKKNRLGLYKYYKPDYNWGSGTEVSLCNRIHLDIWPKRSYTNVLLEFKGLGFLLGEHEPFFCSMFLYDAINKIRLTETFYFDFNTETLKSLINNNSNNNNNNNNGAGDDIDQYTQSKHIVVSLPQKQDKDIWIFVKVNKIMQGNPEQVREPYMKLDEKETTKVKTRISGVIKDIGKRLGKFHQPFCSTAIQLVTNDGVIKYSTPEKGSERCDLYKAIPKDLSSIDDLIDDIREPTKKKKLKTLLGTLTINIFKPENELPPFNQRVDPSYDFVKSSEPFNIGLQSTIPIPSLIVPHTIPSPSIVISSDQQVNNNNSSSSTPIINITPSTPTTTNSLQPSSPNLQRNNTLLRGASTIGGANSAPIQVIREIQSFHKHPELVPHYQLINNLYLYPETINLNKAHGRNVCIKIEIRDNDSISQSPIGLKMIYGKSSNQRFSTSYYTETHYHNKSPDFIDEIKVKLPIKLPSNLHVLFTFYHVICKVKKGVDESENLIGFAVLPLYRDENFVGNGLHQLPLCIGPPKDKYLSTSEEYQLLENGKNVFKLDLHLNSTIYPQNRYINNFLLKSQSDQCSDDDLNNILNHFNLIDPLESIKFFPVIMNQLLSVICSNRDPLVGCYAIKALFVLLSKIQSYLDDSNIRVPLFVQYITHIFDNIKDAKTPVYNALCTKFVYFLMRRRDSSHTLSSVSISSIFSFTWFINDIIVKSLSLYKLDNNNDNNNNNNNDESQEEFIRYLQKIITFNIHLIHNSISSSQDGKLASEANNNLALFIRDLFGVYDRGAIIDLVFTYIHDMNEAIHKDQNNMATTLMYFKFDFLKIITDYEHYINLNIPIPYSINNIPNLSLKITDAHPISGIFQKEVLDILFSAKYSHEVRMVAFNSLTTLLVKHEYDTRYQEPSIKERISGIYFQLVLEVLDNYEKFVHWSNNADLQESRLFCSCLLYVLKNISRYLLKQWIQKEIPQRINLFFKILEIITQSFEYQPVTTNSPKLPFIPPPGSFLNNPPLNNSNTPTNSHKFTDNLSSPSELISSSFNNLTSLFNNNGSGGSSNLTLNAPQPPQISTSGKLSKDVFGIQQKSKHKQNDSLSPIKELIGRSSSSSAIQVDPILLSNIAAANNISGSTNVLLPGQLPTTASTNSLMSDHLDFNRHKSASVSRPNVGTRVANNESTLCTEANLIVLDVLELFIKTQYSHLVEPDSPVMERVFLLFVLLLKKRQSHRFIHCLFASLRSFVCKFRNHFFDVNNNNFCGLLSYEILRYCNFPSKDIRSLATALLYGMIRINSQDVGNFGRMKIQATIALSNLAKSGVFGNDFKNLERSFKVLSDYSTEEAKPENTDTSLIPSDIIQKNDLEANILYRQQFSIQIHKMSSKLSKIIRDTVRANILKANSDPETIHELYSEIAAGYSDTPIIRIDWLNLLSNTLINEEQYFESSICKTRIALLIINYLDQHNLLPCKLDLSLIDAFCPGLKEIVVEEDQGVCTSPIFSISGLTSTVYLAINQLRMGDFFEYSILLYKLLIPLYEKLRDFESLANCYQQIHKLYKEIINSNENKSRMLGRYYRVGFYGDKFEDLNGREFIYKEPKLTHLFALSERLKTFYNKKFGELITVFPDSGRIEAGTLDPSKPYLQITSLKPYFDPSELDSRPAYFELHTLLQRFVFITPFTLNSTKSQSNNITEQFHRKTILSIEHTAPNMLKRYPVIGREEFEISPIENSIETIEIRNNLLTLEISQQPPNIKTLQGVLQGSVLLQVNAGALEICRGFLSAPNRKNWEPLLIEKLIGSCKKFLKLCETALSINRNNIMVINSFHQELESGYKKLYTTMVRYIRGEISSEADEHLNDEISNQNDNMGASVDDDSITDLSYDERTEDSSIKEQQSILDHLTPSFLKVDKEINSSGGKKKGSSLFLGIKEDKKKNRHSSELKIEK